MLSFGVPLPPLANARVYDIDESWQAHTAYGVAEAAVFVVRPDGYLGLVSHLIRGGVSHEQTVARVQRYLEDVAGVAQ